MKRSEVRQVTIVTEACTEGPFNMPRQFPKSFKDDTAVEIPQSEGVSLRHSTQNRVDCKASWTQACEVRPHTWTKAKAAGRHCLSQRIRPKSQQRVTRPRRPVLYPHFEASLRSATDSSAGRSISSSLLSPVVTVRPARHIRGAGATPQESLVGSRHGLAKSFKMA